MSGIKVYVGCSLKNLPEKAQHIFPLRISNLKDGLIKRGHTVLEFRGIGNHDDNDVYTTDIGNVMECDLFVAVCDYASTGLGIEIGKALCMKKPVLAVSQKNISKMVTGAAKIERELRYEKYRSIPGLINIIQSEIVRLGLLR